MQTTIKIQDSELDHFRTALSHFQASGQKTGSLELISVTTENSISVVSVELTEPVDLFELGRTFSSLKPEVKLSNQTTLIPDQNGGKPAFRIEFK